MAHGFGSLVFRWRDGTDMRLCAESDGCRLTGQGAGAMRARYVQVEKAGGFLTRVTREVPEPRAGEVRVRVEACGVCHSDSVTVAGLFPFISYPRVPGHEIVGRVDSVGEDVPQWKAGQRVGIGWYGGHCRRCGPCRRGDLVACQNPLIPGVTYDGGYAEYVVAPAEALAAVPDSLKSVDAAPLLCAGITTFNALRNTGAKPPDTVAILGMGGLGHLGVQFAAKMGFNTVAIARGAEKEQLRTRSRRAALHGCSPWSGRGRGWGTSRPASPSPG